MCGCAILCTWACICTSMLWVCMFVFAVWGFIVLLCLVAVEQQVCRQAFSIQVSCFGQNWAQEWCVSQSWYWDWAINNTNREDSLLGGRLFIFLTSFQALFSFESNVSKSPVTRVWKPVPNHLATTCCKGKMWISWLVVKVDGSLLWRWLFCFQFVLYFFNFYYSS